MTAKENHPLWSFVRLERYSRPPEPAQETVRKGFFRLWDRLGRRRKPGPIFAEENLSKVPWELLDQVAPVPDWREGMAAVTAAIENWMEAAQPENPVQVFVGPSYSGTPQILKNWARGRGWELVPPPEAEEVLAGGSEWLARVEAGAPAPLVLTHLEHCYLRHYNGLSLLRRLLEIILSRRRRWLVACDSWAWAFFRQVFKVDAMLPSPWILAPFDQERLQRWLPDVAKGAGGPGWVFRQSDTGKFILPPAGEGDSSDRGRDQVETMASPALSPFLKYLAAYSRGIPGIAWAIWRHSLYLAMEAEADGQGAGKTGNTIWVKPWSQITQPGVPNLPERSLLLMILHALMLHGGLCERVMPKLLPISPMEIIEFLYILKTAGLAEPHQDFWRVTPQGYPAARQSLQNWGYLVDDI